jgi:DNA-directed RNA polymerase specialized sigma24 family protein
VTVRASRRLVCGVDVGVRRTGLLVRPEKGVLLMADDGSVTHWFGQLQAGNPAAAQELWERYFRRLVGLARARLRNTPRGASDDEDVALSAFASFCRCAEQGRFPQLSDRDGLWRLLVVLTIRKVQHMVRHETRQKRRPITDRDVASDEKTVIEQVLCREPTPDMAAEVAEEYGALLRRLGDSDLETIAMLRMEGYTVEEIAQKLGLAARSIKRKLALIRTIWKMEAEA